MIIFYYGFAIVNINRFVFLFVMILSLAVTGIMVLFHQAKHFETGLGALYFIGFLALIFGAFWSVRKFLIRPLEMITRMVQVQDKENRHYFIAELSMLSQALTNTFHNMDVVTKLSNRVSLIDYLSLHRISSLAILNIDRFSDINDVYGVAIGDQILAGYGHWLKKKVEKTTGIRLYKLGSDEYALVFDRFQKVDDSIAFLEYLIDKTEEESFVIDGIEVVLSITVGFDPQSEKLLEHATRALKQAKLERKRFCVYTPLIGAKKEQANNIEWYKEIKEALEELRIVPYFQPIVDNRTHKIIRYEALIRLIKRDGVVVPPHLFLDIAKKIRLYPALTKAMIDGVVERFEGKSTPVSINLSSEDLLNGELADYIEDAIVRYKVGKLMIFEILESEGISNYAEVSTFIDRFKMIGCSFAIDDFGSGYSNFEHLLKLNIDTLKIDGSLIKNLPHDHNTQIIVRHICDFAHEMGMTTVAEFVANEAIYQKVVEFGIDASQGYFFYEPQAELLP